MQRRCIRPDGVCCAYRYNDYGAVLKSQWRLEESYSAFQTAIRLRQGAYPTVHRTAQDVSLETLLMVSYMRPKYTGVTKLWSCVCGIEKVR